MDTRPDLFKSPLHELCFIFTICQAQFLAQGSITMAMSTMNTVVDSFSKLENSNLGTSTKIWYVGAYALTLGTFILISGRLGDMFGLKKIMVIGWGWSGLWSLITGLSYYSKSDEFLIFSRALQGIGFAFILPCAVGILGSVYPTGKRKNMAFAILGASAPVGATVGALMAALVAQKSWWPWCFWLQAISCILLGVLGYFAIPGDFKHQQFPRKEIAARMDLGGVILGISGLILFNFVWNQAPLAGWTSAYILALLPVSVVLIAMFFYYEMYMAEYPLLPRSIFTVQIGLVLFCISFGWGSFGIWQYYYWSLMMNLRGHSALMTAVSYIPLLILGVVAAMLVGFCMSKKTAPYIISFSMVGFMMGDLLLALAPVHQSWWRVTFGQMFLLAWGMDCSFPSASIILSDYLPKEHQGMAGSLVNTVLNYSVSLFLAISSTVETQVLERTNDTLKSYRCAIYFGVGLAVLAVLGSFVFVVNEAREVTEPESVSEASIGSESNKKSSEGESSQN